MKQIATSICPGLGDNLIARMIFDTVKLQYDQIRISHDQNIVRDYKENDPGHLSFLKDFGNLLFTEQPFYFDVKQYPAIHTFDTIKRFSPIAKPNLQHLLCKGIPLNTDTEYVCITTKVRMIPKKKFLPISIQLWEALNRLTNKYKLVIMGERELEEFARYRKDLPDHIVYSIYNQIIANVPAERVIDLTVPTLGRVATTLTHLQQDSLIMKNSKFTICLGDGGNLWHAIASANKIIAYRDDDDHNADLILHPNFTHVNMNKNWNIFIEELKRS
jgi:hypothetical protein